MTADDFAAQMSAFLPPGKAWSKDRASVLTKFISGLAPEYARVQARAEQALLEANPTTADEMLDEWEFILGLPDSCTAIPTTTAGRQAAIAARLLSFGGHNNADYEAIAVALGHAGTQVITRPYEPFVAGVGAAGDPAYNEQWAFVYTVDYQTNLVTLPNNFSSGWANEVSTAAIAADVATGPSGVLDADRITYAAAVASRSYSITAGGVPTVQSQFSVWLKSESGIVSVVLTLKGSVTSQATTVLVDNVWQKYTIRYQSDSATYKAIVGINGASPFAVLAWGASIGYVDPILECRLTAIKQAHSRPEFERKNEYHPTADVLLADYLGNLVVDSGGYFLIPG
jgi:uncharacterized protein YmfQ (DUF2313 family)